MIPQKPIVFTPFYKQMLWGGTRIFSFKGIPAFADNIGESWEISALPGQESSVESGEYKGMTLSELVEQFGEELLGSRVAKKYGGKFPLLIKFIDAHQALSLQVHPDDDLAMRQHKTFGKSELWYILQATPEAKIYAGFNEKLNPDSLSDRIADGSIMDSIIEYNSKAGDVFFIPAGRVHAIGAGNLLVEIQEASDITYRIFDYNRKGENGMARQLHTKEAKEAIDFSLDDSCQPRSYDSEEKLVECNHFKTLLHQISSPKEITPDRNSFTAIVCIQGDVEIKCKDGKSRIQAGHSILIPANTERIGIDGKGSILMTQA